MDQRKIRVGSSTLGSEEADAAGRVILSGWISQGPEVEALERELAQVTGVGDCVVVANGSAALELSVRALDPRPGDEIITSPLSFFATAGSIIRGGAVPVLADVQEATYNIDPDSIASAITERTIAIMPVHLYGRPCDMNAIARLADRHGLQVIEDSCQALGAKYKGQSVGSFGIGCFSFYGSKNVTCGEGGAVTVSDPGLAERLRSLRNHGSRDTYVHERISSNFRMTDVQAAILRAQLTKLPWITSRRQEIAGQYDARLDSFEVVKPPSNDGIYESCYHLYTIRVPRNREAWRLSLAESGVESRVYYPTLIDRQPAWDRSRSELMVAGRCSREVLSIPCHPNLIESDIDRIVRLINELQQDDARNDQSGKLIV